MQKTIAEKSQKSYSEVTKFRPTDKTEKMKTKEVVIVYPKEDMSSDQLKAQLKTKLNIKTIGNIGINSVKRIRNNGLVIECNDRQQCEKLENNINSELKDLCEASLPKKKNPRLIIYNIFNDKDSEQSDQQHMTAIKEYLIAQNEKISDYFEDRDSEELVMKFFIKSKNENFRYSVIETEPKLRKLILESKKLNIFWLRNTVKDFISITRCFKCLGFGHSKNNCKSETEHCSSCVGTHSHLKCKSKNSNKNCINCLNFNQSCKNPNITKLDVRHDALYSDCPSLKRIKNLIISKINYD